MRKTLIFLFLVSSLVSWAQSDLPQRPNPPRLVNDLTNSTLSNGELQRLERKLLSYEDTTSTQVAILIVNSLNGYEIADFAQRVGESWGVGRGNRDNGIMMVVALQERRMNISTGYGLEGVIPDAAAFTIIDDFMKPRFRQNDYYGGLDEATDVIFKLASGEFTADQVAQGRRNREGDGKGFPGFLFFILIFFVIPAIVGRRRRRGIGSRGIPWWAWLMMGSGMNSNRRDSNWDNFRGGGGGFRGGSGFGGGGGFGGFGGGSFGGGGASGSW